MPESGRGDDDSVHFADELVHGMQAEAIRWHVGGSESRGVGIRAMANELREGRLACDADKA